MSDRTDGYRTAQQKGIVMLTMNIKEMVLSLNEEYYRSFEKESTENIDDLLEYEEKLDKEEKAKDLGIGRSINSFK